MLKVDIILEDVRLKAAVAQWTWPGKWSIQCFSLGYKEEWILQASDEWTDVQLQAVVSLMIAGDEAIVTNEALYDVAKRAIEDFPAQCKPFP